MRSLFAGRQRETAFVSGFLVDPGRYGGVLLVLGDPGIGKSSLLSVAESRARTAGWRVLTVTGVEPEASFLFAGLHELVDPVMSQARRLPAAEQAALLAAFGLADGPAPDPFQVALAVTSLLVIVAQEQPIAVIADDAHWLDAQTQQVLAVLGHQASSSQVSMIAAMRPGYPGPIATAGFSELHLGKVDEEAAMLILAGSAPELTDVERERILREADGNPLALRELPESRTGDLRLPATGPRPALSARLERAFAGRAAVLPPTAQDVLLIAAVDSGDEVDEILAAAGVLSGVPVSAEDLRAAAAAHLVLLRDGKVEFLHPLIRSGVVQAAGLSRFQAANAALAAVLGTDPYRQVRHRAQSILGPDDTVADRLSEWAVVAAGRGALLSAIADLERAAQLTTEPARRGRRLLDAAEHGFGLGRVDIVDDLVSAATRDELSESDRARAEWLREIFDDGVPGDAPRVFELCALASRSSSAERTDLSLNLLLGAALRCWWADTGPEARERVVAAAAMLTPQAQTDARHTAILAVAEPLDRCEAVRERLAEVRPDSPIDADAFRMLGMAAHAVGDEAKAVELLGAAEVRLRAGGRLAPLSQVLSMQVMALLDLGHLERAAACAEEGERLARQTGQPIWRTGALVCDSIRVAMQGQAPAALRMAAEAGVEAGRRRLNDLLSCVQLARGLAWLSAGRDRDAYLALRRALDPADPAYHRRECFGSVMFLADAAVRAGHVADAREVLRTMERVGESVPSPILHAHLAHARAVLADEAEAEDLFQLAVDGRTAGEWALPRANSRLAYGIWLRRRGRVREAGAHVERARAEFDRIGALTWSDQARRELVRCGLPVVWPGPGEAAHAPATARTRQVRTLAEAGASVRQIADSLYLPADVVALHSARG